MRAAVLQSPKQVVIEEIEPPRPGPGEVRIRLEGAGICASELPVWEGREWFRYPREPGAPGHEGWGTVDALGAGVKDLRLGQRVAMISERAHAEADLVPAANVVALPEALAAKPFPGEPLACAVNACARAGVAPEARVAIVGAGFQALLLAQLCAPMAAELAVVSRRAEALERARAAGATSAWGADDGGLERQPPFDVVFEATGHQQPLDLASRLVGVRGRLVIVGYHQDGRRSVDMQQWNWRGLDVINAHERDPQAYVQGLRGAVGEVLAGRLDPGPLLTHAFALEDLGDAYRIARERPAGFVKAVWTRG